MKEKTGFDLDTGAQDKDAAAKLDDAWIKKNSKPCPKCSLAVTKNDGCNHMTCRCGHQFCWICRREWNDCGGTYKCNKFDKSNKDANSEQESLLKASDESREVRMHLVSEGLLLIIFSLQLILVFSFINIIADL